jgi:hypothetical protein
MQASRLNLLAEGYLARVEAAARVLRDHDREELVADLRSHLAAAISADASDAEVLNILESLGRPTDIVAAANPQAEAGSPLQPDASGATALCATPPHGWGNAELLAIAGLVMGTALLLVVGWLLGPGFALVGIGLALLGLGFAWASPRWTPAEKRVAAGLALLPLIAFAIAAVVFLASEPSDAGPPQQAPRSQPGDPQ